MRLFSQRSTNITADGLAAAVLACTLILNPAIASAQDAAGEAPRAETALAQALPPVRALGSEDAPVRLDLYTAFNCLDCAAWHLDVLPAIREQFIERGQVRLVFHDIAVEPMAASVRAAMIGLCSPADRFFDVAHSFMSGLRDAANGDRGDQWYANAVATSGRDADEMEACATREETYNLVVAQNSAPILSSFTNFPGVVVNGVVLTDISLAGVSSAVQASADSEEY